MNSLLRPKLVATKLPYQIGKISTVSFQKAAFV